MIAIPQMDERAITARQIERLGLGRAFLDRGAITSDRAQGLLRDYTQLSSMSLRQMAEACFVSKASFSRFCRYLGFSDFAEFKGAVDGADYRVTDDYSRQFYDDLMADRHSALEMHRGKVVQIGHAIDQNNQIGCMITSAATYPHTCDPADILATERRRQENAYYCGDVQVFGRYPTFAKRLWNAHGVQLQVEPTDEIDRAEGTVDFYTFSYYNSSVVTTHVVTDTVGGNFQAGARNEYLTYSDWGWAMDPTGLQWQLEVLYDRYQVPLMVVENSLPACTKGGGPHFDKFGPILRRQSH